MLDSCFASQGDLNSICDFFLRIQDFFSWIDQRVNVNEGVIALVALLAGIGMQNVKGARRFAGIGFLVLAVVFAFAAVLEGPSRTLRGVSPFRVVIPSLFRNVHGDRSSVLASDEPGRNSIQLLSGDLLHMSPSEYLKNRCPGDIPLFASRNEIDNAANIVFSFVVPPGHVSPNACYFSWHEKGQALDHYEVYVVLNPPGTTTWRYAHMHLRAEKPTHALVREDYTTMRNSLLVSAGVTPPAD